MTEREKCFVINVVRAYYRLSAEDAGRDPDEIDHELWSYCKAAGIKTELLEQTRREGETLIKAIFAGHVIFGQRGN